ncbi:MAG: cytochrome c peroxidase [Thalassolituus sp.]
MKTLITAALTATTLLLTACGGEHKGGSNETQMTQAALGEALFHDVNLSFNRTQSCASCHNAATAFTDPSLTPQGQRRAASIGDDGVSLGDRNTPTAMYGDAVPEFNYGTRNRVNSTAGNYEGWFGGQFWDGRAADLAEQAGAPLLNPGEMNMPDKTSVITRIRENSDYETAFTQLFGADIFEDTDAAYAALEDSIAAFEQTDALAPYTSKYDRFLSGDYQYSPISKAAAGKALFFSQQFTNCATCHQLKTQGSEGETFSNYEFHNIGVPVNTTLRNANGLGAEYQDTGLASSEALPDGTDTSTLGGKFRTPTLRNVGVTAPYMHNGVFQSLDTVIRFYDRHLAGSDNEINPETGIAWAAPEVADNISTDILQTGPKLSDSDIEALKCFLYSLTDEAYEALLPEDVASCGL